jgi:hypothetical protein
MLHRLVALREDTDAGGPYFETRTQVPRFWPRLHFDVIGFEQFSTSYCMHFDRNEASSPSEQQANKYLSRGKG